MPPIATPPLPSSLVWREFGRPYSGEAQDWATWEAPLGDGGDALYRSLVLADGAITERSFAGWAMGYQPGARALGACQVAEDVAALVASIPDSVLRGYFAGFAERRAAA